MSGAAKALWTLVLMIGAVVALASTSIRHIIKGEVRTQLTPMRKLNEARTLFYAGRDDEGFAVLDDALAAQKVQSMTSYEAMLHDALFESMRSDRPERQEARYNMYVSKLRDLGMTLSLCERLETGRFWLVTGHLQDAIAELKQVRRLATVDPNSQCGGDAYIALSFCALAAAGNVEGAVEAYRKARSVAPDRYKWWRPEQEGRIVARCSAVYEEFAEARKRFGRELQLLQSREITDDDFIFRSPTSWWHPPWRAPDEG